MLQTQKVAQDLCDKLWSKSGEFWQLLFNQRATKQDIQAWNYLDRAMLLAQDIQLRSLFRN
jgi:hypothetical protein